MAAKVELTVEVGAKAQVIRAEPAGALSLSELLRRHDLPLNTRCGQRGVCDGCLVELVDGQVRRRHDGAALRVEPGQEPQVLRACEYALDALPAVRLRVPERSALSHEPQVLSDFRLGVTRAHDPLEPQTSGRVGAAVDIGTTTAALMLVDRRDGQVLARTSDFNRQLHLGDDVLTRINLCRTDPTMLGQLQQAVVGKTLRPLLEKALAEASVPAEELACIAVAANTTMLHLLAGVDPSPMGVAPFTPAFLEHRRLTADALGLADRPAAVHLLPSAAAYVGADITAGVLCSGLAYDEGPSLLVDVGTNGEIVLKHGGRMLGCATAAGPAFEGAGLSCGMRASSGAIAYVQFGDRQAGEDPIRVEVIGNTKPVGLCGSAYLDLLARGVAAGVLGRSGRFERAEAERRGLRLQAVNGYGQSLRIARGLGGREVAVTETDVANLLQAKAAIAAGILTLLEEAGLQPRDIRRLYLAGGFGMHMNIHSAIGCGLLPGFTPEQVELVGNTSLGGAFLALLDASALAEMARLAQAIEIVELNLTAGFEMHYIDQLML